MTEPALLVLVGTKAQFIKTAPVLRELDARGIGYRLVYTGQHSETFDILEQAFGTRAPDDVLVPAVEADTHGTFLLWSLRYWRAVWRRVRSRAWKGVRVGLVHGDTASTLFGAMAIRLAGADVGHIEAGLRSARLFEPFPEEIIRRLVSRMARWHYAPDADAARNLRRVRGEVIDTAGNTLRDALLMSLRRIGDLPAAGGGGGYAIVSMHRSENLGSRSTFDMLLEAVLETARRLPVKFVLHPATRAKIQASGWLARLQAEPRVALLDRMDYPDFVRLLLGCRFLMTDGGSNQEEATMLGLPTLLLRRTTERMDGLHDNVVLSGLLPEAIRAFVDEHADRDWSLRVVAGESPSARIVDSLAASLAR
jgi:UDP-N-acetylglucosamine 2-epimerase (non-hydrolysing)